MNGIGGYMVGIIAAAMIIAILSSLTSNAGIIKLVGGIVLLVVILQPLVGFKFDALESYLEYTFADGENAAQTGSDLAEKAMADIIKAETEAYILDKARLYRANINVEVELSTDEIPRPAEITVTGNWAYNARTALESIIENDLGIPKERQRWIGTQ